jgi:hypothetical protein
MEYVLSPVLASNDDCRYGATLGVMSKNGKFGGTSVGENSGEMCTNLVFHTFIYLEQSQQLHVSRNRYSQYLLLAQSPTDLGSLANEGAVYPDDR